MPVDDPQSQGLKEEGRSDAFIVLRAGSSCKGEDSESTMRVMSFLELQTFGESLDPLDSSRTDVECAGGRKERRAFLDTEPMD